MTAPTNLRDTRVKRFSPAGVSDSQDATDEFPGACSTLTNLVPALSTKNIWVSRPAATLEIDFSAWPPTTNPGIVSVFKVVANIVYGMCGDLTAGVDKPFAYNLLTGAFLTVSVAGGSVFPPIITGLSTATILPTMDLIGVKLVITHPNYPLTSAGCKGTLDISTPTAPAYSTGDVTGALTFVALGAIPNWVVQFNQRAYYGVNATQPSMVASDVLTPGVVTNAGQALTFGNALRLVIAAPLGLSNQLGGIIQSLMVFQGFLGVNIQQVTGDFATTTWAVNTLNVATGVTSMRAVCSSPLGLAFMSPQGLRIIGQDGNVSDPIGSAGTGVVVPFTLLNGNTASRLLFALGSDAATIRVSMWDSASFTVPVEYWYNLIRKVWSGPHKPITAFQYDVWDGAFLTVANPFSTNTNGIYLSFTDPNSNTNYIENGATLTSSMISALLEDNGQMAESELAEMQVVAAAGTAHALAVSLLDSAGNVINSTSVTLNPTGLSSLNPWRVDFASETVFNRVVLSLVATAPIEIGDTWMRLRTTGYITNNS